MFDRAKDALYRAIATPRGDAFAPLRVPKDLARRLNATLGSPLAPLDELARRAAARDRLVQLRSEGSAPPERRPVQAPVHVYFKKDRNVRELVRIEELLAAKGYTFIRLDVADDEATTDFVARTAHVEQDELPIVFVGDRVVGNYEALVRADASGELEKLVRPS